MTLENGIEYKNVEEYLKSFFELTNSGFCRKNVDVFSKTIHNENNFSEKNQKEAL